MTGQQGGGDPWTSFQETFGYDGVNRLSSVSDSGGWSRSFSYDQYGNMWVPPNWTGIAPSGNMPASNVYNAASNQIGGSGNYDLAGNQTVVNGNTLLYDAENRQVSVTNPPGSGGGTETYLYDGLGERVEKSGPAGTTVYVYDAFGQLAAEYGSHPSSPCATCYLSFDYLGSTRMVTDGSGNLIARHDYLPFGEETGSAAGRDAFWAASDGVSQKFTGQYRDSETSEDFFNARYFTAALGRFNSPDPANAGADLTDPQTWNGYAYVRGNPLNATDPTGMFVLGPGGWPDDPFSPCWDPYDAGNDSPCWGVPPGWSGGAPGGSSGGGGGGSHSGSGSNTSTANTSTASGSTPFPPGSFPGGETLGLPPGMSVPGPLSPQVLLGLWGWDCSAGVCVPGMILDADQALVNEITANRVKQESSYLSYGACLVLAATPKAVLTSALGIGGTAVLGKSFAERFPLPPGIVQKVPERAAAAGLKWGTKGNVVGAVLFSATFEVELYKGATACAAMAGYTPRVLEP